MYRKLDEAALGTILEAGIAEFARCGFQPRRSRRSRRMRV